MDRRDTSTDAIGNTPLIQLRQASEQTGCTFLGKAEFINPGGLASIILTAVLVAFSPTLWAVDCVPGDIFLGSQAEIDDFQLDYGPCDRVVAGLDIMGADISNLDGLLAITNVGGALFITETFNLGSLDGLSSLTNVNGDFAIFHNFALTSIDGLSALSHVGGRFGIYANPELPNIDGLSSLTTVDGFMAVTDLHSLTNINGLSALTYVGSHLVFTLDALLPNLDPLVSLSHIGGSLIIKFNHVLTNVDGLSSVTGVGFSVDIVGNDALTNLDGLSAFTSVGMKLNVQSNHNLADCSGLLLLVDARDNASPGPGAGSVPDVGDEVLLANNRTGCNSIQEILARRYDPMLAVPTLGRWSMVLLAALMLLLAVWSLK